MTIESIEPDHGVGADRRVRGTFAGAFEAAPGGKPPAVIKWGRFSADVYTVCGTRSCI